MKKRYFDKKIGPNRDEIKYLEVLKKIIESGWIVGSDEMRQIMKFLEFKREMFIGKNNFDFREFIMASFKELNISGSLNDYVIT